MKKKNLIVVLLVILLFLALLLPCIIKNKPVILKNDGQMAEYLRSKGWETEETPYSKEDIRLPNEFDKILNDYNELQRAQGYDLAKYKGRFVRRTVFKITNFPGSKYAYATLFTSNGRLIAADIYSPQLNGEMLSLNYLSLPT